MRTITIITLFAILSIGALAQEKPVKIVFDVTSKDTLVHQAVLRHVTGMAKAYPQSSFEVVIYGGAVPMVVKDQSTVAKNIEAFKGNPNVSFKVCAQSLKRNGIETSQLVGTTTVVPDGILEIVNRQGEGWGYIKEAHN